MNQIIISQSNVDLPILLLLMIMTGVFTSFLVIIDFEVHRKHKTFNFTSIFITVLMFVLFLTSFRSFTKQYTENVLFQNGSDPVTKYYDLKKNRSLITAEKKDSAPNWLAEKVEVKVIDEDKSTYQVQFEDKFYEINKKDVK